MTARLVVTPKTTEQNRIVRTGKFEVEVTNNNKKLCSRYCTIEAMKLTTDRYEASRGLLATAELLVKPRVAAAANTYTSDLPDVKFRVAALKRYRRNQYGFGIRIRIGLNS